MASNDSEAELQNVTEFRKWFSLHGGYIHPNAQFKRVPFGLSVYAVDTIAADAQMISCPFSVAITPKSSKLALSSLFKSLPALDKWTERQLICTYLCFHWVLGDSKPSTLPPVLAHLAYIQTLPSPDNLLTALQFTSRELDAFKGSNLYQATLDRKRDWEIEWEECRNLVADVNGSWGTEFTWDRYLAASTYLSSRAFPSSILSQNPSLQPTDDTHPVLLPGLDALNHAHATPVSWIVTHTQVLTPTPPSPSDDPKDLVISLVLHNSVPAGEELFNNYGPKPNSELILGYGFALPFNPSDTIVLQVGVWGSIPSIASKGERKKFEIGRAAAGASLLWEEILSLVALNSESTEQTYEDHLEGAGILGEMLLALLDRLPEADTSTDLRPEVKEMLAYYLEGQRDILESLLEFARDKEQAAIESASAQGIVIVFQDAHEGVEHDADES